MKLDAPINASDLPQAENGLPPVPAGTYPAVIKEAELKATKNGTGQYIKIRFDLLGSDYPGRVVFTNLNIRNANPKAEEIARQQLGDILRAIGLATVHDTDELVGGTLQIKIAIREAAGGYDAQNEVKGYKAMTMAAPKFSEPPSFDSKPVAEKPKAPWEM